MASGMGVPSVVDKKSRIDDACKTAEEFVNIFYDKIDNKRHTIGKIYLETATLAWNGNKVEGSTEIQKFFLERLPSDTFHQIHSLDAQPIEDIFVGGQTTVLVQVGGTVSYSQSDRRSKPFQQNFLLTAQGDHWKVATDTFRLQEVIN